MTPEEFAALLQDLELDQDGRITDILDGHAEAVVKELQRLLRKYPLDLTEEGKVKQTAANLRKVTNIVSELRPTLLRPSLFTRWAALSKTFESGAKLQNRYFGTIVPTFKDKPIFRDITKSTINRVSALIRRSEVRRILETPIRETLNHWIRTGGQFEALNDFLTNSILRQPVSSSVDQRVRAFYQSHRGVRLLARDAVFQYSRDYMRTATEESGLQWYLYDGGKVDDTRPFCRQRADKYFHVNEVRSWPSTAGDWQGRRPGTNSNTIFTVAGGYNCRHHLIPVSILVVPQSAIRRARRKGFYKPKVAA